MKSIWAKPTSFLDHVYLVCTQRECETSKDIVDNFRNMFESRISSGAEEKLPFLGKLDADIFSWSYDMKVMQRNVWSDIASWRTKLPSNCTKSQLHVLMAINSKKQNWDLLETCQKYALKLS